MSSPREVFISFKIADKYSVGVIISIFTQGSSQERI